MVAKAGPAAVKAIVFAADRKGPNYASGLSDKQIAQVSCSAFSHRGSDADYLMQTVDQLEGLGIRDADLWRQQRLAGTTARGAAACCGTTASKGFDPAWALRWATG
jgi:cation transport protein ChaC